MSAAKKPKKAAVRSERRGLVPPGLSAIVLSARRDLERARDRYESLAAMITSHTLWEHEDGRNLCDMDGQDWPCSTVVGLAFVYDVRIPEAWEQQTANGVGRVAASADEVEGQ